MKLAIALLLTLPLTFALAQDDDELPPGEPAKPAGAEERTDAPADPEARLALSKALKALASRDEVVATASVEHETAPAAPGAPAGAGRVVMIGGVMGGQGTPFEGEVEGWRRKDGSIVIVSKEALPGFALHTEAGRTIRRATYEAQPPNLTQLEAEFGALLDVGRFTRLVQAAKLVGTPDEAAGTITFRGETPATLVDSVQGQNPFGNKRVLRTEVELVVTKEGAVRNLQVRVVHTDPMQRAVRGMAVRIVAGGAGGAPQVLPAQPGAKEGKDTPTGWTTYKIEFGGTPSDRAKEFLRTVERTLKER